MEVEHGYWRDPFLTSMITGGSVTSTDHPSRLAAEVFLVVYNHAWFKVNSGEKTFRMKHFWWG